MALGPAPSGTTTTPARVRNLGRAHRTSLPIDPREDGPYAHLRYEHMESASDAWWDDHLDRVRLEAGYLARRGLLEAHELRNIRSPHPRADGLVQPWDQAALDGLADAENTPDHDHDGGSR
ncbi:MAG: hypothetical protein WKF78_12810 [Candidatus Limnocylindrales bacterium]